MMKKDDNKNKDIFEFFNSMYEAAMEIRDCLNLINHDYKMFMKSRVVRRYIAANLGDIGEKLKTISNFNTNEESEYQEMFPDWQKIYGLRNRIVHSYGTLNFDIIWNTAYQDIPVILDILHIIQAKHFPDQQYGYIALDECEVFLDKPQKKLEEEQSSSNSMRM